MKKTMMILSVILAVTLTVDAEIDMAFFRQLVEIPSSAYDIPQINRATRATQEYLERHGVFCVVERHPRVYSVYARPDGADTPPVPGIVTIPSHG